MTAESLTRRIDTGPNHLAYVQEYDSDRSNRVAQRRGCLNWGTRDLLIAGQRAIASLRNSKLQSSVCKDRIRGILAARSDRLSLSAARRCCIDVAGTFCLGLAEEQHGTKRYRNRNLLQKRKSPSFKNRSRFEMVQRSELKIATTRTGVRTLL